MKVTLISLPSPYIASRWEKSTLPPLGLGYLAAYLEERGIACEILDAHVLRMKFRDIYNHLIDSRPDVVGVTFTTENRFAGFDTIRTARAALPQSLIVAGGPHVSAAAEDTLSHIP
ncbi:MAG: cobalamin-dependent protein, partial [Armatimonadetes bacterium]|nr:cobalamin-dependent protein [Armatimonadota bacterium]